MNKLKKYYKEPKYIHYSNCHEDSDFAIKHIKGNPKTMLTIASALDNSLAFLLLEPQSITAIDSNETQIYLCNLKKCGIERLCYEDFLSLIGIGKDNGKEIYNRIKDYLDEETRAYFDNHLFLISEVGIINCGKFEYYHRFFKKHILPKIHSQKNIDLFMKSKNLKEQNEFYKNRFNNLKLRLLFSVFFSKTVMKRLGRDKEYFAHTKGKLAPLLKCQFDRCVECNLNKDNPYLQQILLGKMETMPTYLIKENYAKIQKNIHRLEIRKASFSHVMSEDKTYDFMYLSDIFEYMTAETTASLSKQIYHRLNQNGQALLYNMMIERHLCSGLKETKLNQDTNRTFYYINCYHYEKS